MTYPQSTNGTKWMAEARKRVSLLTNAQRKELLRSAYRRMKEGGKRYTLTLDQWSALKSKWRHSRRNNFRQAPGSKLQARTADRPAVRPVTAQQADTTPDKEKAA